MSHLWDAANFIVEMGIPESVSAHGGIYFWKNNRDVPDNWHAVFDYPSKDLVVTFACSQSNRHNEEWLQLLGRDKTLEVNERFVCRTYEAEWKEEVRKRTSALRSAAARSGANPWEFAAPPEYSLKAGEMEWGASHVKDFFECVRSRGLPRCHVGVAFEEAATIMMAVESFRQERKTRWDRVREEIV